MVVSEKGEFMFGRRGVDGIVLNDEDVKRRHSAETKKRPFIFFTSSFRSSARFRSCFATAATQTHVKR